MTTLPRIVLCRRDARAKSCPALKRMKSHLVFAMWREDIPREQIAATVGFYTPQAVTARVRRAGLSLRGKGYDAGGWKRRKQRAALEAAQ